MYMFIGSNSVVILRSTSNRQTVGRRPFITTGMPFAHAAVTTQEDGPFVPACQVVLAPLRRVAASGVREPVLDREPHTEVREAEDRR